MFRGKNKDDVSSELEEVLHDIKAPLSAILAGLDLLDEQDLSDNSRDEVKRSVRLSAHSVVEMIEILSHSRALSTKGFRFKIEPFFLYKLLDELVLEYSPLVTTKGVSLKVAPCDESIQLNADIRAIKRVFTNLLSNALRSIPPGSTIELGVAQRAKDVVISVRDDGPGFSTRKLRQGGLRYNASSKGTGLGLTICRRIIKSHNGRMYLRSIPGKGTTVAVFLPSSA